LTTASGSFSTRISSIEGNYATTGSNVYMGAQTVCANITSTGTIVAQTINVQQVTSSIVYSSGSNIFGNLSSDVQQMTGSLRITGSLNTIGNACATSIISNSTITLVGNSNASICLIKDYSGSPANPGLVIYNTAGNVTFQHNSNGGGLNVSGITCIGSNFCVSGDGYFAGKVGIGPTAPAYNLHICCSGQVINNVQVTTTSAGSEAGIILTTPDSIGLLTVGASATRGVNDAARCDMVMGLRTGGQIRFSTDKNANITHFAILGNGIGCFACTICSAGAVLSGDLTVDTNTLYVDSTNNRVGVGTATPTQIFDIRKDANEQIAQIIENRTTGSAAVEALYFVENSSTFNAFGQLTRFNTGYTTNGLLSANRFWVTAGGGDLLLGTRTTNDLIFHTCGFATSNERMRITSGGNVGIGTATPVTTNLNGSLTIVKCYNGDTPPSPTAQSYDINQSNLYLFGRNAGITLVSALNEEAVIAFGNSSDPYIGGIRYSMGSGANAGDIYIQTGGTCERLRILSGGNVGIGTASPCYKLDVNGTSYFNGTMGINGEGNGLTIDTGHGNNGRVGLMKYGGSEGMLVSGNTTSIRLSHRTDSDYVATGGSPTIRVDMLINASGIACFGGTVCAPCFATISDYRMKSNLRPIEGLSIIMNTKPYKFDYNYDCSTSFGMIAHELQETLPEAVFGHKDGEVMQGVDYMKLLPITIKAIQEQHCTICTQATRINLLESCLGLT